MLIEKLMYLVLVNFIPEGEHLLYIIGGYKTCNVFKTLFVIIVILLDITV